MTERELFLAALDLDDPRARALALDRACAGDAALRAKVEALLKSHEEAGSFLLGSAVLDGDDTLTQHEPSDALAATRRDATAASPGRSHDPAQADPDATSRRTVGPVAEQRTLDQAPTTGTSDSDATTDGPDDLANLHCGTNVRYFGDYELQKVLGRGGMGVVYKARQVSLNRAVALKMIKAGVLAGDAELQRFQNEAEAVALLDHAGIVPVYQVGEHNGQRYFSMKLVEGGNLADQLQRFKTNPRAAATLLVQTAEAVHHAHMRGILHRDLKPANILIDADDHPHVTDFGLAKRAQGDVDMTQSGAILGTPAYMSPEQANGRRGAITTATDIYGLGAILYALLTGHAPFAGESVIETLDAVRTRPPESPTKFDAHIPLDLETICLKCLEKDPRRRYASAHELAADLNNWLDSRPITARRVGAAERAWLWCKRKPAIAALAASVVLAAGLGVGLLMGTVREQGLALTVLAEQRKRDREDEMRRQLPEIKRAMETGSPVRAYKLALEARKVLPGDDTLAALWSDLTSTATLQVEPSGTSVLVRDWNGREGDWLEIGTTPLVNVQLPNGPVRWKFEKPGLVTQEWQHGFPGIASIPIRLLTEREVPAGMIHLPLSRAKDYPNLEFDLGSFAVDRHEVTNREFLRFAAAGGYRSVAYWPRQFFRTGKEIPREAAIKLFVDRTGKPGPATWSNGQYPVGEAEFPVRGVSWYEAAAYAAFVGRDLPTSHHWHRASAGDVRYIGPLSNFEGKGPARVCSYQGITPRGVYDLAGNVKEWCFNEAGDDHRRIIRGGSWNEPSYNFLMQDADDPMARLPTHGFRCVKYDQKPDDRVIAPVRQLVRPFEKESPATSQELASYLAHYEYDASAALKIHPIASDLHPEWSDCRHETISIEAAYGGERFVIHLFWPRNASPPFETVVWYPGNTAFELDNMDEYARVGELAYVLELVRTGRLVCFPVYKGTLERRYKTAVVFDLPPILRRDAFVMTAKDLRRTVDYLLTREDVNGKRLIYGGFSQGAYRAPVMLVVEPRFQAALVFFGGYWKDAFRPEIESLKFARAVKTPLIMLNGTMDNWFPVEPYQRLFYEHLGSPDKQIQMFENQGHVVSAELVIPAADKWLRARWPAK